MEIKYYIITFTKEIKKLGSYPLDEKHICFNNGHTMYNQFTFHNHQSSYGTNKCGRCGFEEEFQYDYIGSNPMYYINQQ